MGMGTSTLQMERFLSTQQMASRLQRSMCRSGLCNWCSEAPITARYSFWHIMRCSQYMCAEDSRSTCNAMMNGVGVRSLFPVESLCIVGLRRAVWVLRDYSFVFYARQ